MPDNQHNQNNAVSNLSNGNVDDIEVNMGRMKIEKNEGEEEGGQSRQYPDRPGEPNCSYYLRTGFCGFGSSCRFNHPPLAASVKTAQNRSELPQREGQPDCGYYLKTGTCKYGSTCKYNHPLDTRGAGQVPLNSLGLPIRQEEKPCPYYMRNYTCKFGAACKFDHPPPTSVGTALPSPVGAMGSTLPSAGVSYMGALPSWSLSKSPYIPSSRVPDAQTYMPFVFPPLQGPVATPSWNGHRNQGELVTSGQVDLSTVTMSHLPERPDQPECRYFMSTGSCHYGSTCKFHHPKERTSQLAMSYLGPHGLPIRPGEDTCAYFSNYGFCKYGPTCKFNHPFAGYLPGYYFGMPSMPIMDQPYFPSHRNTAIPSSFETSQSKSLKITDWIQKPETVEDKNLSSSETKPVEYPHGLEVDNHPNARPTSAELPQDQSD